MELAGVRAAGDDLVRDGLLGALALIRGHHLGEIGRCREMQGDAGRCREMQGDTGRYREIWLLPLLGRAHLQGDAGRYREMREIQGDVGRYREM